MNFDKTMNFKIERDKDVDAQKILKFIVLSKFIIYFLLKYYLFH